jgi:excisionase family DNA binding protein
MYPLALGVREAANLLGISPWTVRKYVRHRRIQAVRIGRRVLIEPSELRRIIESGRSAIQDQWGEAR